MSTAKEIWCLLLSLAVASSLRLDRAVARHGDTRGHREWDGGGHCGVLGERAQIGGDLFLEAYPDEAARCKQPAKTSGAEISCSARDEAQIAPWRSTCQEWTHTHTHTRVFGGAAVRRRAAVVLLAMGVVASLPQEVMGWRSELYQGIDAEWAWRKGREVELMAATLALANMARQFLDEHQEGTEPGIPLRERYAAAGRLIRLIDATQDAILASKDQKHRCWTCQRDRQH